MESSLKVQMTKVLEKIKNKSTEYAIKTGLSTGIVELDTCLRGIAPGELIVISAQRNFKTSIALNIVSNISILQNKKSCYISTDAQLDDLIIQLLCCNGHVNIENAYRGTATPSEFQQLTEASKKLSKSPLYLKYFESLSLDNFKNIVRNMKSKHGIEFVVIDFLQCLSSQNEFSSSEKFVSHILKQLKMLAEQLAIPVLALYSDSEKLYGEHEGITGLEHFNIIESNVDALLDVRECKKAVSSKDTAFAEILFANKVGERKIVEIPYITTSMQFSNDSVVTKMDDIPF